jgi:hypothetical protein
MPSTVLNPSLRYGITTLSWDRNMPGMLPYLSKAGSTAGGGRFTMTFNATNGQPTFGTGPMATPSLTTTPSLAGAGLEYGPDGRGVMPSGLLRLDLNRTLPNYPPFNGQTFRFSQTVNAGVLVLNEPTFAAAHQARQNFAKDIYDVLRKVTGAYDPFNYSSSGPTAPQPGEIDALRYLAQLAVNIVDYIDYDDISTPFNWGQFGNAAFQNDPGVVASPWVFGTEIPKVLINEAYAEYRENQAIDVQGFGSGIAVNAKKATFYEIDVWAELINPHFADVTMLDGGAPRLHMYPTNAAQPVTGYPVYQLQLVNDQRILVDSNQGMHVPSNTMGTVPASNNVGGTLSPGIVGTVGQEFQFTPSGIAGLVDTSVINPLGGNFSTPTFGPSNAGFYLVGPKDQQGNVVTLPIVTTAPNPPVPGATVTAKGMSYQLPVTAANPNPTPPLPALVLQRLAIPYAPPNPNPANTATPYNPYITVDYFNISLINPGVTHTGVAGNAGKVTPPTPPLRQSVGRVEPFAGATTQPQNVIWPNNGILNQVQHTFYQQNVRTGPGVVNSANAATWPLAPAPGNYPAFNWLPHMDRQLVSPMELLQVSGYRPHELTQQFNFGNNLGSHQAPWLSQASRLYRFFEFTQTHPRQAGTAGQLRVPGKLNINNVWDFATFQALCDAQAGAGYHFSAADVQNIWNNLIAIRNPDTETLTELSSTGTLTTVPGENYPSGRSQWFMPLSAGWTAAGDTQYPRALGYANGLGIGNTLLQPFGAITPIPNRLLEAPGDSAATHPYQRYELLNKIFNNLTTRSNCFAVWCTLGFFEVNQVDATGRIYLGQELGRAENKHVRHRMFAIVDRSAFQSVTTGANITAPATVTGPGTFTITPSIMSGTSTTITGNIQQWSIQPGTALQISAAGPTEEVIVKTVSTNAAGVPVFTADFAFAHPGTMTIQVLGNPGPPAPGVQFNPHASIFSTVVPHFSIIE